MLINGSTVDTDSLYVTDTDGNKIDGAASADYYDAVFTPTDNLSYDATYTAVATTKIQAANAAGTTMGSQYSWSFTTASAPVVPTPTPAAAESPTPAVLLTPTPVVVITTPQPSPSLAPSPVVTTTPAATPTVSPTPQPSPTPAVSQ